MSIQDAVDSASDNDTIFLSPGTYVESGIKIDKNITLQGLGTTNEVILDGNRKNSIILVNSVSKVKFFNITFINGKGPDYGGAIHSEMGGQIYADHCDFVNNTSGHNGGAVTIAGEQHRIKWQTFTNYGFFNATYCNFINNAAGHDGGAVSNYWGNSYIYNSVFRLNYAERDGGAIDVGIYSTAFTENCIFDNNTAKEWGGALYNWPGQITVNNCTITNNKAGIQGGAMTTSGGFTVTNSIIANNTAVKRGGIIFIAEETPNIPSTVIFKNNTISGNTAKKGSLIFVDETTSTKTSFDGNYWDIDPTTDEWAKGFLTNGLINMPTVFIDEDGNTYIATPKEKIDEETNVHVPEERPDHVEHPEITNQSDDDVKNDTAENNTQKTDNTNSTQNNTTQQKTDNTNSTQTNSNVENNAQPITQEIQKTIEEIISNTNMNSNSTTIQHADVGSDNLEQSQNQNPDESQNNGEDEKSAHEITKKDVSKQTEQSPIPYIVAVFAVLAILSFGYIRKRN